VPDPTVEDERRTGRSDPGDGGDVLFPGRFLRDPMGPRHETGGTVLLGEVDQHPHDVHRQRHVDRARRIALVRVEHHLVATRAGDVGRVARQAVVAVENVPGEGAHDRCSQQVAESGAFAGQVPHTLVCAAGVEEGDAGRVFGGRLFLQAGENRVDRRRAEGIGDASDAEVVEMSLGLVEVPGEGRQFEADGQFRHTSKPTGAADRRLGPGPRG
jgi:hypothetical protein